MNSRQEHNHTSPRETAQRGPHHASVRYELSDVSFWGLFCYQYDAERGTYTADVMNIVRLTGGLTVAVLGVFLGLIWWRGSRSGETRRDEQGANDSRPPEPNGAA